MIAVILLKLDPVLTVTPDVGEDLIRALVEKAGESGLRFALMLTTAHTGALFMEHESRDLIPDEVATAARIVEDTGSAIIKRRKDHPDTAEVDCWKGITLKHGLVLAMAQAKLHGILMGTFAIPTLFTPADWEELPSQVRDAMARISTNTDHTLPPLSLRDPSLN